MTIRPYRETDKEAVRYICLNSDGPCDADEKGQFFLLTTYCDYFIEQEGHNCFVCADENDKAVGYILCAENYDRFWVVFLKEYLPRLDNDPVNRGYALKSTVLQAKYKDVYPAHLHIDLLPEYQRMGLGSKLTHTLFDHLRSKNIPGVMLTVWIHNQDGQQFYEKFGFEKLDANENNIAFGMKL